MAARAHPLTRDVTFDVPLAKWTSVRVGGTAEALVKPSHPDVLVQTLAIAKSENIPVSILGGGANTLVGDGGVPGVTLKLQPGPEVVDVEKLTLPAGAAITRLITLMKQLKLVGAEFLAGIPGTIGGATAMNAGTKNGECMRIVDGIELATADGIGWVKSLPFVYRHTAIPEGAVVTRVRFKLSSGDLAESQAKMEADLGYRKRTQPLDKPNFGSVFTNPPGDHAGRLIESVQLKGHTIGKAQISTLHANWIVNLGGATARDVVALMDLAQTRVRDATGVTLTPEVKRIGVFVIPIDKLKTMRVGVLLGGLSTEREVSQRSGAAVAKALREAAYTVVEIDVQKDLPARLIAEKIDVAFIALHGRYGEDGSIQGLLESMFIPYTGSGVLASSVGMEKVFTKQVFVMRGIPTPKHKIYSTADEALEQDLPFPYPVVVKPSREGSSVGIHIAKDATQYRDAVRDAGKYAGLIMVEQFIKGREVQGAVLDDEALGVIEIVPAREFYDYEAKYGANSGTQYIFPARLDPEIYDRVNQVCLQAHVALGCSGATRSDAIVTESGEIFLLEVNTLPGMTASSLLPKIAAGKGISFTQLCERLLQGASLKA